MEIFAQALLNIFDPVTLVFMITGVAAGLLPAPFQGSPSVAIVLTLPFTFTMPPAQGLATMIAVLVGGLSGGLMSGILTGIPEPCHQLQRPLTAFLWHGAVSWARLASAFGHHFVVASYPRYY